MYTSHFKLVTVPIAIMYHFPIELPRSSKKYMAHIHRHDVTSHFILIASYLEVKFTLLCNQQLMSLMQPWHLVGCGMFDLLQVQLFHHFRGHYIIGASTVNYHFATLPLNLACSSKQGLFLWGFTTSFSSFNNTLFIRRFSPTSGALSTSAIGTSTCSLWAT